jgi:hypothetical protein
MMKTIALLIVVALAALLLARSHGRPGSTTNQVRQTGSPNTWQKTTPKNCMTWFVSPE